MTTILTQFENLCYDFIKYCQFDDALYDFIQWCSLFPTDCSITGMGQNGLQRIFQITTLINDLAAMWQAGFDFTNFQSISKTFTQFGQYTGQLARYLTNFNPALLPKK